MQEDQKKGRALRAFFAGCKRKLCAMRRHWAFSAVALALSMVLLFLLSAWIVSAAVVDKTESRILSAEQAIAAEEPFDCIVILGCAVYDDGSLSAMLYDRVSVGSSLFQTGIADWVLMSGDHVEGGYSEIEPMKETAISMGVKSEFILTDPMGYSTYESMERLVSVYGMKRVLIVTQEFHLPRALYIAEQLGLDAYGVKADQRTYLSQAWSAFREVFARCKDVIFTEKRVGGANG